LESPWGGRTIESVTKYSNEICHRDPLDSVVGIAEDCDSWW
jgi:hypothetical protein